MKVYKLILAISMMLFSFVSFSASIPFDVYGAELTTGNKYAGGIDLVLDGKTMKRVGGGNILNSVLDGKSLAHAYCIDILHSIGLRRTYSANYNNKADFSDRPELTEENGGKIAWLILNIAETAVKKYQQAGLQALIWEQVYGASRFTLKASTNDRIETAYQQYSAALVGNTASVNSVLWIDPYHRSTAKQDLVAWGDGFNLEELASVPAPAPIFLLILGLLGLTIVSRKTVRVNV
jgi:hypothetical protein